MKKVTIERIKMAIELHENMKGCYFYSSPCNSHGRRSYEKRNSLTTKFTYKKQKIEIKQVTDCSCKNVYYKMLIIIDNEETKKDLRFLKKLIEKK